MRLIGAQQQQRQRQQSRNVITAVNHIRGSLDACSAAETGLYTGTCRDRDKKNDIGKGRSV